MDTGYAYFVSMSVRYGLLALLERAPMHGYQLRVEFERSTGVTWPLNIGQVYTTLARLSRDGLVTENEGDEPGKVAYALTDAGRAELAEWFASPVAHQDRPRDELAIKVALAVGTPGVDVPAVLRTQRTATLRTLRELTRLKTEAEDDEAWLLILDAMIFRTEAEVRWLDHIEARLAQPRRRSSRRKPVGAPAEDRVETP